MAGNGSMNASHHDHSTSRCNGGIHRLIRAASCFCAASRYAAHRTEGFSARAQLTMPEVGDSARATVAMTCLTSQYRNRRVYEHQRRGHPPSPIPGAHPNA